MARNRSNGQTGDVYEIRKITNWRLEPMKGEAVSRHRSLEAAMAAKKKLPWFDGHGASPHGEFKPYAVVRIDADGTESPALAPPIGRGLMDSYPS